MHTTIHPQAPFELNHTLAFMRGFSPCHGEQHVCDGEVRKALVHDGRAVAFRLRRAAAAPALAVALTGERPLDAATARAVTARVADQIGAAERLEGFYAHAADDAPMARLAARYRGLHHVKFASPFEAACWAVINRRIGMAQARKIKDAITRRAGRVMIVDGIELPAFPDPEALLAVDGDELARLARGPQRAAGLVAVARAFAGVDERFLRAAPLDDVRAWLRAIHGVGPFTVSFVLFRALGRFDGAVMVSPVLVAAAERAYGRTLGRDGVARLAASYGEWGGHWMLYLWASTFID